MAAESAFFAFEEIYVLREDFAAFLVPHLRKFINPKSF
jgi:hypothetical protein